MSNQIVRVGNQLYTTAELRRERQRKARLSRAAPDLLAALQSLVVNDGRISGVSLGALAPMVKRAIAKAEGG